MQTTGTAILVLLGVVVCVTVLGVAISPSNAANIIGFASITCVSLLALLRQEQSAVEVKQVKQTLAAKTESDAENHAAVNTQLQNLGTVANTTLTLVNNKTQRSLQDSVDDKVKLAALTGLPADKAKLAIAREALAEHIEQQAIVDAAASAASAPTRQRPFDESLIPDTRSTRVPDDRSPPQPPQPSAHEN
jgi:hypothetical protein